MQTATHNEARTSASSALSIVHFKPRSYLARKGENPSHLWLIKEGWAIGFQTLRDGRRHISRIYLPGDICDPTWLTTDRVDHMVMASSPIQALPFHRDLVESQLGTDRDLTGMLSCDIMRQSRIYAEWLVALGCKSAIEKIGQFFCEIAVRLKSDLTSNSNICDMPLSQQDIAEYTGMTPIHVCRTLKKLRSDCLADVRQKKLHIFNFQQLAKLSSFDGRYLETPQLPATPCKTKYDRAAIFQSIAADAGQDFGTHAFT